MTASSPFRDLFIELPHALFEGIAEQAVRAAPPPVHVWAQPRWQLLLEHPEFAQFLRREFGWLEIQARIQARRSPLRDEVVVLGRLECGHTHVVIIPEFVLRLTDNLIDTILNAIDRTPRPCFDMRADWTQDR
jgi:hypothetical protein